jgi:hypothetical protein
MTINLKRSWAVLFLILATLLFSSCAPKSKTFDKRGMHLVLDTSFKEVEVKGQDIALDSVHVFGSKNPSCVVVGLREDPIDIFPITKTVQEYARLTTQMNGLPIYTSTASVFNEEGIFIYERFEYTKDVDGSTYKYFATCRKSSIAFYLIQFGGLEKDYEKLYPQFEIWAAQLYVD